MLSVVLIVYQLFESLFNDRIAFTDQEWIDMFDSKLYELSPEGKVVQCMTRLPNLMRRAKATLENSNRCQADLISLQGEARWVRNSLEPQLSSLHQRLHTIGEIAVSGNSELNPWLGLRSCHYIRSYSLGLAVAIFINEIQVALSADPSGILKESHQFATEIVSLAKLASQYRPLGAYSMGLCLGAAELGASDSGLKVAAQRLQLEHMKDLRGPEVVYNNELRLVCGHNRPRSMPTRPRLQQALLGQA